MEQEQDASNIVQSAAAENREGEGADGADLSEDMSVESIGLELVAGGSSTDDEERGGGGVAEEEEEEEEDEEDDEEEEDEVSASLREVSGSIAPHHCRATRNSRACPPAPRCPKNI